MTKTRIEHDSLGDVPVPEGALYGAQTFRALNNYPISGRTAHPALIRAYLHVKSAAATANARCKSITEENEKLITQAIQELLQTPEKEWPQFFR